MATAPESPCIRRICVHAYLRRNVLCDGSITLLTVYVKKNKQTHACAVCAVFYAHVLREKMIGVMAKDRVAICAKRPIKYRDTRASAKTSINRVRADDKNCFRTTYGRLAFHWIRFLMSFCVRAGGRRSIFFTERGVWWCRCEQFFRSSSVQHVRFVRRIRRKIVSCMRVRTLFPSLSFYNDTWFSVERNSLSHRTFEIHDAQARVRVNIGIRYMQTLARASDVPTNGKTINCSRTIGRSRK